MIAALRAFEAEYGVKAEVAAGHSLGEYSALVAAGALEYPAALRAVRERGRQMQEACPAGQGSMAALIGLDLAAVREVCEQVSRDGQVAVPANLNAPGQIVIAGHAGAVKRAIEIAKERGSARTGARCDLRDGHGSTHGARCFEEPVDAAGGGAEGVHSPSLAADEDASAHNRRLRIRVEIAGEAERPFHFQPGYLRGSEARRRAVLEARVVRIVAPAVPVRARCRALERSPGRAHRR